VLSNRGRACAYLHGVAAVVIHVSSIRPGRTLCMHAHGTRQGEARAQSQEDVSSEQTLKASNSSSSPMHHNTRRAHPTALRTHSPPTKATMRLSQAQEDHQILQGRIGWCWDGLGVFQEALPRQRAYYCQTSRRARKMGMGRTMVGEELLWMGHISIPYTAKALVHFFEAR